MKLLKNNKIFEFSLLLIIAILFWYVQKKYFTLSQPGLSLISDSVMYLVQSRVYVDGAGDSGSGLLAVNMKGYSILIALVKMVLFRDEDWTYYTTLAQNINIIFSFFPFIIVYITCKFYKKNYVESILFALVALSFPRVWYYNQYAMTEVFTASMIMTLTASLLFFYKVEKFSYILAGIIAISYFFGFTSKTVSQYVVIALGFLSIFHFTDRNKRIYIILVMITCWIAKFTYNLDAYAYTGFFENTIQNILTFNPSYYLIVIVSFIITVSWSSQYIIPLFSINYTIYILKRIEIHYLASVLLLPLLITSLFSGTINTLGQYRGFMLFEPTMYYLTLVLYFTNEPKSLSKRNKSKWLIFALILSITAPVFLLINKFYFKFAFHAWDSMHMPIYSYIYNEAIISIKTWVYTILFCFIYMLAILQNKITKIIILMLTLSALNIVVTIKGDYSSEGGRNNFASTELMHLEYSKELKSMWPDKNIILGRVGGDSWTVMGYPYVMRYWGKWTDQDFIKNELPFENNLILSKNMIANLELLDKKLFSQKYYLYNDEDYKNTVKINFSQVEEYFGEYVFGENNGGILYSKQKKEKKILIPVYVPKNTLINVAIINDYYKFPLKSCNVTNKYHDLKSSNIFLSRDVYYYDYTSIAARNKSVVDVLRVECNLTPEELSNIVIQIKLH